MMINTRRDFLKTAGSIAIATMFPTILLSSEIIYEKSIALHNIHTGERLKAVYWADGEYDPSALADINHILRDHRINAETAMDVELVELIHNVKRLTGSNRAFEVISGYRHPYSNSLLHNTTDGVAKKSLHMEGKAIDLNMPGIGLKDLRQIALDIKAGGVGYYPASNFIHIDVGSVRAW